MNWTCKQKPRRQTRKKIYGIEMENNMYQNSRTSKKRLDDTTEDIKEMKVRNWPVGIQNRSEWRKI